MKNSKTPARGRFGVTIKHPTALRFEQDFMMQVPGQYRGLKLGGRPKPSAKAVLLWAEVYVTYPNWKQDPDFSLIYDLLQKTGVIRNDRWIRERHELSLSVDEKNPGVEVMIGVLSRDPAACLT